MKIEKTQLVQTQPLLGPVQARRAHGGTEPADQFSKTQNAQSADEMKASTFIRQATSVLDSKGLRKSEVDYLVMSSASSPDGTMFIAYRSAKKRSGDELEWGGYVSAVSPGGGIKWEAPVKGEGLSDVKVGPDGTAYALTKDRLIALNSDGTLKFDHSLDGPVRGHWMDSTGNHYFTKEPSLELCMVSKDGMKTDLPEGLKGITAYEVVQVSPDELRIRHGDEFSSLDLAKGRKRSGFTWKDPVERRPNFYRSIDGIEGQNGKGVLVWVRNNTTIPSRPYHDDFHMGIGGFRRWGMPHPPLDDHYYSSTTITDMSLEALDGKGNTVWAVRDLGSDPVHGRTADGTVVFSQNKTEMVKNPDYDPNGGLQNYKPEHISSGRYYVGTITPDGKRNDNVLLVEGRVSKIFASPGSGNFVICHGEGKITEFAPDGKPLRSCALPEDMKQAAFRSMRDGNAILAQDGKNAQVFSLDLGTGKLTACTDTKLEHTHKVLTREMEKRGDQDSPDQDPTIEVHGEWVDVGGVKVFKRKEEKA
jgi:hypothetical protein